MGCSKHWVVWDPSSLLRTIMRAFFYNCQTVSWTHSFSECMEFTLFLGQCSMSACPFLHRRHVLCYAKSLQSCPTLCDPIDGSPPGSPVPGILQSRTLEWVAISFSNAWKWKVKVKSLSRVRLLATPWTAAYQAPPSMGFSRQKYWSGVPLPSPKTCTRRSKMTQFITIRDKKLHWCPSEEMHKLWHGHKPEYPTAMTMNTCTCNTSTTLSEWQWIPVHTTSTQFWVNDSEHMYTTPTQPWVEGPRNTSTKSMFHHVYDVPKQARLTSAARRLLLSHFSRVWLCATP